MDPDLGSSHLTLAFEASSTLSHYMELALKLTTYSPSPADVRQRLCTNGPAKLKWYYEGGTTIFEGLMSKVYNPFVRHSFR